MNIRNITLCLLLLLFSLTPHAQDPLDPGWLWAERGGSSASLNGSSDYIMERVVDVAVDSDNNYYYLAEVGGYNFTIGEMEFDTYNHYSDKRDIFVFSTDDNGNFRWSKVIGGGWDDRAASIVVGENNNIYVGGTAPGAYDLTPVHFDTDFVMGEATYDPSPNNKRAFLIKYDSNGNFQWLRHPEGEEVPFGGSASLVKTVVEPNGHTHSLVWFWAGIHLNGQLMVEPDSCKSVIVNYDENGDLLDFIPLNMQPEITWPYNYQLAYDANLDRYYIADTKRNYTDTISINGYGVDSGNRGFYLAAVNNQGEVVWFHENNNDGGATGTGDIQLDNAGHIYFTGHFNLTNGSDSFAGYAFEAIGTGSGAVDPFLIKLDSDGNLLWGTNAQLYSPFNGQSIVVNGANVYLGLGMLKNTWDGLDVVGPTGQGLVPDIQIMRFDAQTGEAQEVIQNNHITLSKDAIMAMVMDSNGALVVGGYFGSSLFYGTDLHIQNNGQDSDFFIAKYQTADTINVGGIENRNLTTLKVYPNPTTGMLYLKSEVGLQSYALYDLQGRIVKQGSLETSRIDMSGMESGVYIIRVEDLNNTVQNLKVVKE